MGRATNTGQSKEEIIKVIEDYNFNKGDIMVICYSVKWDDGTFSNFSQSHEQNKIDAIDFIEDYYDGKTFNYINRIIIHTENTLGTPDGNKIAEFGG